ncbi:MAG: peptidase U62 [bacterium]|nr:peptidase U62 [bacterium]
MIFLVLGLTFFFQTTPASGAGTANVVLKAMEDELAHSMKVLGKKGTPPPYFISYRITDSYNVNIEASYGSLRNSSENRSRFLDTDVRVGDHKLDNTHPIRGDRFASFFRFYSMATPISIEDDPAAIKSAIWRVTDEKYKTAVENLIKVKANKKVTVKEEDESDDFSKEKSQKYVGPSVAFKVDAKAWEKKLKEYSAIFNKYPNIYGSNVILQAEAENKYFANSDGSSLQQGRTKWRIMMMARTKAEDGMDLYKNVYYDSRTRERLPDDKTLEEAVHQLAKDVTALRDAPLMEPFTGPAILSGRASGVFFHEIFGHRIEGHRQKGDENSQTFTKKINQSILPDFISVYDDPTIRDYENMDLNGHYLYDDEGVKSERVTVVKSGILKNFLLSRSPIEGFSVSNGHGRAQTGRNPVSRQGNLLVESSKTVPFKELRKMLLEECKKQGIDYGLMFDDISGGFTFTGRVIPNAFNVMPITVYRIYVDGRPDELVRGVDLIGTPLTSFSKIIACGNKHDVFNGYCGAESGSVPVSAISPAVLTTQIEVQKKFKASDKPPVLPPPTRRTK